MHHAHPFLQCLRLLSSPHPDYSLSHNWGSWEWQTDQIMRAPQIGTKSIRRIWLRTWIDHLFLHGCPECFLFCGVWIGKNKSVVASMRGLGSWAARLSKSFSGSFSRSCHGLAELWLSGGIFRFMFTFFSCIIVQAIVLGVPSMKIGPFHLIWFRILICLSKAAHEQESLASRKMELEKVLFF